jgi:general stress protein 26
MDSSKFKNAKKDALGFLRSMNTAVVATAFEHQPFASTVYYIADDDFNVYFSTKRNTIKSINTGLNKHVAFVVGSGPSHISIQARGTVEVLTGKEKKDAIRKLKFQKKNLGKNVWPTKNMSVFRDIPLLVLKVIPTEMLFMNLDCGQYPLSISHEYHQIIPQI